MAFSKLVQAFADAWGSLTGAFAENDFENVNWSTFQNFSNASAALHDRGPNAQRGLHKRFRYLTQAEVVANGGEGEALESLDYDTCCVGTHIVVQYYQPDPLLPATREQLLVAAYDPDPGAKFIYSDGSFRAGDRVAAAKFVPAKQDQYGYVRRDTNPASISDWRVGELSLWELRGKDEFATAKQAGGPWPAFTGVDDAYWTPAAAPEPPLDAYTKAQADALLAGKADLDANGQVPASQLPPSGASTFAQLGGVPTDNAALAGKAELGPDGKVLASQLPERVRLCFTFPAGQSTSKIITLAFPDQPGQYQVEVQSNLSAFTFYLNNVQVVITNQILYLGDEVMCAATVPAGPSGGYIYLRKL